MREYKYLVTVEAESEEQADTVITERIYFTEDYGFEYAISEEKVN